MIILPIHKDVIKYVICEYICYDTYVDNKDFICDLYLNPKRVKCKTVGTTEYKFVDNRLHHKKTLDGDMEVSFDCNGRYHGKRIKTYTHSTDIEIRETTYFYHGVRVRV
jgi:hypothetical protein